jgi:hypothetical protein
MLVGAYFCLIYLLSDRLRFEEARHLTCVFSGHIDSLNEVDVGQILNFLHARGGAVSTFSAVMHYTLLKK